MERIVLTPEGKTVTCHTGPGCRLHGSMPLASSSSVVGSLDDFIRESNESASEQPDTQTPDEETEAKLHDPSTTFRIPASRVVEAQERVAKANKRLKGYGIDEEFSVVLGEERVEQIRGANVLVQSFTLNKPVLRVNGWGFAAAHEFTANGDTTSFVADPDVQTELDAAPVHNGCDHCGSARKRERVYWLKNQEDGSVKQVGSSCLKGFLGIKPAGLWALENDLHLTSLGGGDMTDSTVFDREQLITAALAASDDGETYVPKWSSSAQNPSTAEQVSNEWNHYSGQPFNPERMKKARAILGWLDGLGEEHKGTYLGDLKSAMTGGNWVKRKHIALAVSAIGAHQRAERDAAEVDRKKSESSRFKAAFLAPAGEKIKDVRVKVRSSRVYPNGQYSTNMLILETEDGHILKWNSSNLDWDKGDSMMIESAGVTDNNIYNDIYQTVIKRPRVKAIED